jgi:hypothetical protein
MGTDLIVAGRRELAGYAGFAGVVRGRARPIAVVAAIDVLAVALAFGALHVTGLMMGGGSVPQLIQPTSAAAEPLAEVTPVAPLLPRLAPPRDRFAAMPDVAVMFDAPVVALARGFTFDNPATSSPSTFVPPSPPLVAVADPEPAPAPSPVPMPRLRPLQQVGGVAAPVIDAADGSLDRLLLRDVVPTVGATVSGTGAALDRTATATTNLVGNAASATTDVVGTTVAATSHLVAPVQTVAQNVTRPVAQAVKSVTGLLN